MYDVLGPSGGISALISSVKKMKNRMCLKRHLSNQRKARRFRIQIMCWLESCVKVQFTCTRIVLLMTQQVMNIAYSIWTWFTFTGKKFTLGELTTCQKLYEILKCGRMAAVMSFYGTNDECEWILWDVTWETHSLKL